MLTAVRRPPHAPRSYSTFELSGAKLSEATVAKDGTFSVSLTVKNNGPAGKCVVQVGAPPRRSRTRGGESPRADDTPYRPDCPQVYFSQQLSSRVRFDRSLLGFAKVAVPEDGSVVATIPLRASDFEMWSKTVGDYVVEPGVFDLYVAQSSADSHEQHLTVTVNP